MDYIGKKFTDLTTGSVVEVKDQFEDVIVLNNNIYKLIRNELILTKYNYYIILINT